MNVADRSVGPPGTTVVSVTPVRPLADVVDLHRYPIDRPGSAAIVSVVASCAAQLRSQGVCSLPGFMTDSAIRATVAVGDRLADQAWHADQHHNVYFDDPDAADPPIGLDHVKRRKVRSSQWAIAYDQLPLDLPIRRLYESDHMTDFVSSILGLDRLHRSADPLDALEISLYHHDDELGWHFDNSEFSVTLMLRTPHGGGAFEYHPSLRTHDDECFDAVADALDGRDSQPLQLPTAPGTLALFRGRHALHRVTPVVGDVARMNTVLSYGATPDMCLTEATQKLFYGRRVVAA